MEQKKSVKKSISYAVIGITPSGRYTIWEYLNARPVNEYTAFDRETYFVLYPTRRLMPSSVKLEKKKVDIKDTRREF